jgi:hypothetical protein
MRTEVNVVIVAIALALTLGCEKKDPNDLSFESVPAAQNSSTQAMSLASAQKADSQSARPSLAVKEDSAGNRPILCAAPAAGSNAKQDTAKEKQVEDRAAKDPIKNLPDLRSGSIRHVPETGKVKGKLENPSTIDKSEAGAIAPAERVSKSKEHRAEPIKRISQPLEEKRVSGGRLPGAAQGSGLQKNVKVMAEDISERYEGLKARSIRYYKAALGFLGNQDDSALIYANKAIQTFENGSLFRVKAEALYNLKYFTNAQIACDVCLNRTDHWDFADVDRAVKLKCGCDKKNYERFPSQESKEQYENACKAAAGISGGK